ncbi:MAG: ABC transporter permease [Candidatus Omnitrophica bacterium]|nr:ABC transporter permease [Candidatus Omnitrophota bacterium]
MLSIGRNSRGESLSQEIVQSLGERALSIFAYLGGASILLWHSILGTATLPWKGWTVGVAMPWRWKALLKDKKWRLLVEQMEKIGVSSLPLVFLTALFTGMVLALQTAYQLQKISATLYIGTLVALSMTRELGPVLTALVVAGRVGAAITAELGTMRVTEQIDAMESLGTDPVHYLAVPRLVALVLMLPLLTIYADIVGILGGYLVGVYKLGLGSNLYMNMTWDALRYKDMYTGLFKSGVFAVIIAVIACYEGFGTTGGAEGVGRSTTLSVVTAFILIIAADCFFTALFYFVFP